MSISSGSQGITSRGWYALSGEYAGGGLKSLATWLGFMVVNRGGQPAHPGKSGSPRS